MTTPPVPSSSSPNIAGVRPGRWKAPTKAVSTSRKSIGLTVRFLLREMLEAFDLAGVGLAILDASARLQHCNRVAEQILALRDGLAVTSTQTLRVGQPKGTAGNGLLEQSRDATIYDARDKEQIAIVAVPRPSGKRPLTVLVRFTGLDSGMSGCGPSSILVFMIDPERPMQGMESHLRQVYGFTNAETELATLLMQGNTLTVCCRTMGIRRPTAATHLQQLFNKTGARTQSQLVSILFRRFGLLNSAQVKPDGQDGQSITSRTVSQPKEVSLTHSFGGRQ